MILLWQLVILAAAERWCLRGPRWSIVSGIDEKVSDDFAFPIYNHPKVDFEKIKN